MTYQDQLKTKKIHRKNQPPNGDLLPPCRVCGAKASGLHYGANACEPCKGFYRRCIVKILKKKEKYVCAKEGNCPLLGTAKRSMCSYCRYEKCLKLGMSQDDDTTSSRKPLQEPDSSQDDKKLLDNLIGIQEEFSDDFKKIFLPEQVLEMQMSVYQKFKLRSETFGTGNALSWEVYGEILNATGIELDDRKSKIKTMAVRKDNAIRNMIEFAKKLPGFCDLKIVDQFALIGGSFFEFWFLCTHKRINHELKVVAGNPGIATKDTGFPDGGIHYSEIAAIMEEKYAKLFFEFAATIQKCELSVEEATLACGIVLTFTDRCELLEPDKVEKIQWSLINCLKRFIKKNHVCPEKRMWQIFNALITLRSVTEYYRELFKSIKFKIKFLDFQELPLLKMVLYKELDLE